MRVVQLQPHSPALAHGCRCQALANVSLGAWWASVPSDPLLWELGLPRATLRWAREALTAAACPPRSQLGLLQCREGTLGRSGQLGGMAQCEAAVVPGCPGVTAGAVPQRHLLGLGGSRRDAPYEGKVAAGQLPACCCVPTCLRALPGLCPCADAGETRHTPVLAETRLTAQPQTFQQAGNFLDETLAPRAACYVTAPACPVSPGALGITGTPCPGPSRCHCRHTAPGLPADPGLIVHRPQCRNKAPQPGPVPPLGKPPQPVCNAHPWPVVLPARLPSAGDELELGTVLPEPVAKLARMQNPVVPRRSAAPATLACPGSAGRLQGWGFTRSTGHGAGTGKPPLCGPRQLWHRPAPQHVQPRRGMLARAALPAAQLSSVCSTALSAALRAHSRAVPAPAVLGGRWWLLLSCSPAYPHCGPSFPAVTFSTVTEAH